MKQYRFIFYLRELHFFRIKWWYSTYRWINPYHSPLGELTYLLDIGAITIGYAVKVK